MTDKEAVQCIRFLAAYYPNIALSTETVVMYSQHLMRWPYDTAQYAITRLVEKSKFFPSVAEILQAIQHLENHLPGAAKAWEEVTQQIRACGTWKTPAWSAPIIQRAVQTLGWYNLCISEHPSTDRAHFLKIYTELVEAERWKEGGRSQLEATAERGYLDGPSA